MVIRVVAVLRICETSATSLSESWQVSGSSSAGSSSVDSSSAGSSSAGSSSSGSAGVSGKLTV